MPELNPPPEWARILSGAFYGFGVLKLLGALNSASVCLSWAFKSGYGWDGYATYACILAIMYWFVGGAELLLGRAIVRRPQLALRATCALAAASLVVIVVFFVGSFVLASTMPVSGWKYAIWNAGAPWLAALALYIPTILVLRSRRAQMLRRPEDPACCAHCGYSLTGLTEPRCPECGTAVPQEEVDSVG